ARNSLLDVALFVAYFPHLVAGPIVRAQYLIPQFETCPRFRLHTIMDGVFMVVFGLFAKCVVADNVAPRVNLLFDNWRFNSPLENWAAGLLFGVQVYGDFAGYSGIAIGLARVMGYYIPANFLNPFGAIGFSDFWRRWHISLSSWLRDYLYIPLGGNRLGSGRTYFNLFATMLLGGLWHGASWMFVLWGAMHGGYLCAERLARSMFRMPVLPKQAAAAIGVAGAVATYLTVAITWIPFRAPAIYPCLVMMKGLFIGSFRPHPQFLFDFGIAAAVFCFDYYWARRKFFAYVKRRPGVRYALLTVFLVSLYFFSGAKNTFVYFQF
ncbi:MAG: hypothetical protein K0Q72_4587, partial [Armatimonadetes bacterium]|nr:hypothetical protein [Armatimonadota bacterium]